MPVSPEIQISNFVNSIKSYFIGALTSVDCFFEWLDFIPKNATTGAKLDKWIIFEFGDMEIGPVCECRILIHCFTRHDSEDFELNKLCDSVLDEIIDESSTNGLKTISFYNTSTTPWVLIGGIMPFLGDVKNTIDARDNTKIKTIPIDCRWGGK
jgi:hypothetical protein